MASEQSDVVEGPAPTRTFAAVLAEQDGGRLMAELTDGLAELVRETLAHGKGGSISLKLSVSPTKTGVIEMAGEVGLKVPKPPAPSSMFYADARGGLHRRDPRQPELPLRQVPAPAPAPPAAAAGDVS